MPTSTIWLTNTLGLLRIVLQLRTCPNAQKLTHDVPSIWRLFAGPCRFKHPFTNSSKSTSPLLADGPGTTNPHSQSNFMARNVQLSLREINAHSW